MGWRDSMMFSNLAEEFTGEQHPLYALKQELSSKGETIIDLVRGNVNDHGIVFPEKLLGEILQESAAACLRYKPDPFGQLAARESIASYYKSLNLNANQIVLTPGTSVSFWYCFKLLAQPGDEVLCPIPSYPLLDYIAKLCDIRLINYRLIESQGWEIDLEHLAKQINPKTKAIVLISPHNPSGMVCADQAIAGLVELARKYNLPIISDEVFAEFLFERETLPRVAAADAPLVFTLNGFSKTFALPGLKLGWIAVSGEKALQSRSLSVLETISDTFLPVSEIAQHAVAKIFGQGGAFLADYRARVKRLRQIAVNTLSGLDFVPPQGGFYLTLKLNDEEEEFAMQLLREQKILVHPGHFYELAGDHLVMTFIHDEKSVEDSFARIKSCATKQKGNV
ncbi:MAG: pyridoxal phosphate-dependent aminotransferase [Candidatus Obscuribacterales bacterium]|nr:pyridoxal phosphate-dependent aminotransferase [Candidatus Obscuribacterales bacterium]